MGAARAYEDRERGRTGARVPGERLKSRQALTGLAAGLLGAAALAGFLEGLLYGVPPRDPLTFAAVALVFTVVALAAAWLPARRAASTNPVIALRAE